MSIHTVYFLYNKFEKDGNLVGSSVLEHYQSFTEQLSEQLGAIKTKWIHSLNDITPDSLIIMYSYRGFAGELESFLQAHSSFSYRQFFVISNPFAPLQLPGFYKGKNFMGSMMLQAYKNYVNGIKQPKHYPAFYVDELACVKLQGTEQLWSLADVSRQGYKGVHCQDEVITPLAIYINEYIQKYDGLKDIDKFLGEREVE